MDDALATSVARLVAIEEIRQLKARYCRYVDLRMWDEFPSLFTEDLDIDFAETTSGARTREEWFAAVRRHFTTGISVHHVHVPEIEILDEDHASAIWPMFDLVEIPADSPYESHTGWGHYTEQYRRVDGRWLISRVQLTRIKRMAVDSPAAAAADRD
jgi:hypothetical protein